jgi:5-hydroxyisourate hydrolase
MKIFSFILICFFFIGKSFAGISTHVLNLSSEKSMENMEVTLQYFENKKWKSQAKKVLDINGRASVDLNLKKGMYKITFNTYGFSEYNFYPSIEIIFNVTDETEHYHIPLLLSEFGYSTYKGHF